MADQRKRNPNDSDARRDPPDEQVLGIASEDADADQFDAEEDDFDEDAEEDNDEDATI